MAQFTGLNNFVGTYTGSYDGRPARLVISDLKDDSIYPTFHIVFTDTSRNETYAGTHEERRNLGHVLTDIELNRQGGSGNITWSKLYLHTWDISYLSGVSLWNGSEFGMSYQRVGG